MSSQQRELLDEIWVHYLSQNEWPIAWEFHSPNRKHAVRETLKSLNGHIVFEMADSQHGSRYELTLLGVLLTSKGPSMEKQIVRYCEYLLKRYQTRPKERTIKSSDVQTDMRLDDEETKLLGRLVVLGNLYSGSAGYSTNWISKEWSAGIFQKVEDFPTEGSLNGEIEKFVLHGYNPDMPVFLEERRCGTSWPPLVAEYFGSTSPSNADPGTVFVVHGRNEIARTSMFNFLGAIGLKPLEWSEAVKATGEASPYIGQVLDKAFSTAQAVIVLMTPDDEACLRKEFQMEHDEDYERKPTGQARPNVLFEAGMAMGRNPKRTVMVQLGTLRPFSDVGGRHVLRMNNSLERRQELADRLKTAGCPVNLTGTEWHTVGSFELEKPGNAFPHGEVAVVTPAAPAPAPEDTNLEQEEIDVLELFATVGKTGVLEERVADRLRLHPLKSSQLLYRLVKRDLLYQAVRMGMPSYYRLTPKGREYLIENKLI